MHSEGELIFSKEAREIIKKIIKYQKTENYKITIIRANREPEIIELVTQSQNDKEGEKKQIFNNKIKKTTIITTTIKIYRHNKSLETYEI